MALEEIDGVEVAILDKSAKLYLSKDMDVSEEMLNKELSKFKITVSGIKKSDSATL
ncbi:hypothetical protein OAB00_01850 [Akkermansiaceae bacterium]|nr:hypothetical protein [Akkermansiaceae bacterium]